MQNDFKMACQRLNEYLEHGTATTETDLYQFTFKKKYSKNELVEFERAYNLTLPEEYKYFLLNVGASTIYIDEFGLGVEFCLLNELESFFDSVFLGMEKVFPKLLIIGSIQGRGDVFGFDLREGNVGTIFSTFCSEEDPETWLMQTYSWSTFSRWLCRLVASDAEDDLV